MIKIPNIDKDPSGYTFLIQTGLKALGLYTGTADNWEGDKTKAAAKAFANEALKQASAAPAGKTLEGDGTWPWTAEIVGDDIVVRGARATCFGGSDDPQDSGETASGISTKKNPSLAAVSLPMDGRQFPGAGAGTHKALDGSPIPKVPWKTAVHVTSGGLTHEFPVIDIGPAKKTGNALDLTIAAARLFKSSASARNFEMQCDFVIVGGAKFVVPIP